MNALSSVEKFTFGENMDAGARRTQTFEEDDVNRMVREAEERGYQRGLTEGEQSSTSQSAKEMAAAVSQLVARSGEAIEAADVKHNQIMGEAVQLAVSAATKLAAFLIARDPLETIKHLMRECLASLDHAPHLVIRCNPEMADAIQKLAEAEIATSSFSGRLVVMGEPDIGPGSARFEWIDGGMKHDINDVSAQITQKVQAFLERDNSTEAAQ